MTNMRYDCKVHVTTSYITNRFLGALLALLLYKSVKKLRTTCLSFLASLHFRKLIFYLPPEDFTYFDAAEVAKEIFLNRRRSV